MRGSDVWLAHELDDKNIQDIKHVSFCYESPSAGTAAFAFQPGMLLVLDIHMDKYN